MRAPLDCQVILLIITPNTLPFLHLRRASVFGTPSPASQECPARPAERTPHASALNHPARLKISQQGQVVLACPLGHFAKDTQSEARHLDKSHDFLVWLVRFFADRRCRIQFCRCLCH